VPAVDLHALGVHMERDLVPRRHLQVLAIAEVRGPVVIPRFAGGNAARAVPAAATPGQHGDKGGPGGSVEALDLVLGAATEAAVAADVQSALQTRGHGAAFKDVEAGHERAPRGDSSPAWPVALNADSAAVIPLQPLNP